METRKFRTLVKRPNKGNADYIFGRISGIKCVLCDLPNGNMHGNGKCDDGSRILLSECTQEQYDSFIATVESQYPGLCEFDYKIEK